MEENSGKSNAAYFLLLGIGIGAVSSLLLAPRTGREMRHAIREKTDKGREALGRRSQELSEVARSAIDKGKEYIQGGRETVSDAINAGKQAYRETTEDVRTDFNVR